MQLDLFLAVLAAVAVRDVAAIAVQRTIVWFAMRRIAKASETASAAQSGSPRIRHLFGPPAPLTPDEMEALAAKCRELALEGMSDGMLSELGRLCMMERARRIPVHDPLC